MKKVLIADDNEQNLYMLRALLEGHGYEVVSARNGAEALEAARPEPPDMIITDILMPVMDGFTLCREWKSDERLKRIPLVFYTATYTDPKDEELALGLGADKFIIKPMDPGKFVEIIKGVIRETEKKKIKPKKPAPGKEKEVFKLYSERLVKKLEKKMLDLEKEVSNRKRAEETLQESEARFRTLFHNAPVGIGVSTLDGRILASNDSATRITGFTEEEFAQINLKDTYYDPEERDRLLKLLQKEGSIRDYEAKLKHKNGTPYYAKLTISPFIFQGQPTLLTAFEDITKRKLVEDELRRSKREWEDTFDAISDWVSVTDLEARIVQSNQAGEEFTGVPLAEIVG